MNQMNPAGRMNTGAAILLALVAVAFLIANAGGLLFFPRSDHALSIGNWSTTHFGIGMGMMGITAVIQLVLAVWVGFDAHRNGANGLLWGVLVFFTPVIGLIVYLLLASTMGRRQVDAARPPEPPGPPAAPAPPEPANTYRGETCPSCRGEIEPAYKVCPVCGASLRCSSCDKPIRAAWKVCPYCAVPIQSSGD